MILRIIPSSTHLPAPTTKLLTLSNVEGSATGLNGAAFANGLLEAEGVAVVPGFGSGDSVEHMVRIGFLPPPDRLKEAAARIDRYVRRPNTRA